MLLDIKKLDPVLRLQGELDASNADDLARVLEPKADRGGLVALDLEGLSFLDASGADVLLETGERLRGRGRLLLCRPRDPVERLLRMLRADRLDGIALVWSAPDEVLTERFTALARLEADAILELLAEDAVWHMPGHNAFSGVYRGRDEIVALSAQMQEATAEYFQRVEDVLAGEEHVAVLAQQWGDREGRILFGAREVTMFRVGAGRVTEAHTYLFNPDELDRFWT
jgi:anti-anti-sigma factor